MRELLVRCMFLSALLFSFVASSACSELGSSDEKRQPDSTATSTPSSESRVTGRAGSSPTITPGLDAVESVAMSQMQMWFEDRSPQGRLILVTPVAPQAIPYILTNQARGDAFDAPPCNERTTPEPWYCESQAKPVIAIGKGDWWSRDAPARHIGGYLALLLDVREGTHQPFLQEYVFSCNGARFKLLLNDPELPDTEPSDCE